MIINITVLDNREIIIKTLDSFGSQNENKATVINFNFPEKFQNANKKIVFITNDGNYWDLIVNNTYEITNSITKYKTVSAYVWLVDTINEIDFRSKMWKVTFNKNQEADDVTPTPEEISGFDTMITQLNSAITKVNNIDIDLTKVENITTVSITNKEGVEKSVEIPDGSDYIITEEDYQEIARIAEEDIQVQIPTKTSDLENNSGFIDKTVNNLDNYTKTSDLSSVATSGSYTDLSNKPSIPSKTSDITNDSGFVNKDVNNLTNYELKTNTGSTISLSIDNSTYVMTLSLKNSSGTVLSTGIVDLPLESVVINGSYDNTTKKVILTLQNGSTVDFSVADLVSGLQSEITSNNKLKSDLIDDTNQTNKFVTSSEKSTWSNKYDKPSGGIPKTDLESSVQTSLSKADTAIQDVTGKEDNSNKVTIIDENSTNIQYPSAKLLYDQLVERDELIEDLQTENQELINQIPISEAEGTNFTINDSSDLKIEDFVVKGDTQQIHYSGKNILDITPITEYTKIAGLDFSYTKSTFTLSGTATSTWASYKLINMPNLISGNNYSFSANVEGTNPKMQLKFRAYDSSDNQLFSIDINKANNYKYTKTFSSSDEISYCTFTIESLENGGSYNLSAEVQLEKSSTPTSYEPYTGRKPVPNPDYPQDIHVITGNCSIKKIGKNLFNQSIKTEGAIIDANGNLSSNNLGYYTDYIQITPNQTYTLSYTSNDYSFGMRIVYYQQDKTFIERTTSYNQTITFTIPNNCCFIKLSGNKNNTNEQLEKSSTKTNYEPYQSQELPITLGNIELCNIGNYADKIYKENGRWYLKKYIKKLVLDGTQNIILDTTKTITQVFKYENISDVIGNVSGTYCNQLVNTGTGDIEKYAITNSLYIALKKTTASTVAEFNTYSSENNFIFYLLLKNPTTTEITDTTLINQLEAILAMKTYKNTTNIVTSGADLPPIADVVYKVGLQSMYDKINNLESRITLLE